ncbi:hypothetical protein ACTXT7_004628 [Hymenolepis weldensis]
MNKRGKKKEVGILNWKKTSKKTNLIVLGGKTREIAMKKLKHLEFLYKVVPLVPSPAYDWKTQ